MGTDGNSKDHSDTGNTRPTAASDKGDHDDESGQMRAMLDEYLQANGPGLTTRWKRVNPKNDPTGQALLDLDRESQATLVPIALTLLVDSLTKGQDQRVIEVSHRDWNDRLVLQGLLDRLLQRKLPFSVKHAESMVEIIVRAKHLHGMPLPRILGVIERLAENRPKSESLSKTLQTIQKRVEKYDKELADRINRLLSEDKIEPVLKLSIVDAWTFSLDHQLEKMGFDAKQKWHELLTHANGAMTSKPSKRFLKQAKTHIDAIGEAAYISTMRALLTAVGASGPCNVPYMGYPTQHRTLLDDRYTTMLRGVVWMCSQLNDQYLMAAVGEAAERCYRKVPGIGPRNAKIGNACVWTLSEVGSMHAIAQLSRLKLKVKHASTRQQLGKALDAAAAHAGMTPGDLEEISSPTFGLTGVGVLEETLGDFTAVLTITDSNSTQLIWRKGDGKTQKSIPKAVKDSFGEELKQLRATAKDIKQMLPPQRMRIERLLLTERQWSFDTWKQRYFEHHLVGTLARRLIWQCDHGGTTTLFAFDGERLVDVNDQTVAALEKDAVVQLWHPVNSDADTVLTWRNWLERNQVTQPFKQAHREIYLLTDAERNADTYSNRFAAHILKQHQMAALMQQRGWRYTLQGAWDSANTPSIDLPEHNMRVEFWVEAQGEYGDDTSGMGIYLYVATDQVRFYRLQEDGPMRLEEVPPIVLTELMRDVDLFVGVCSLGNDPTWQDGGPDGHFRDYWHDFSFGKLNASAHTRRDVLRRLVPQLKIANRCTIGDKFLEVRGDCRTYKIHYGSGNIMMTPNDEYLCIVPDQRQASKAGGKVMLPFEGDRTLSIILSKALMLAEDKKIKDETILSQINR